MRTGKNHHQSIFSLYCSETQLRVNRLLSNFANPISAKAHISHIMSDKIVKEFKYFKKQDSINVKILSEYDKDEEERERNL